MLWITARKNKAIKLVSWPESKEVHFFRLLFSDQLITSKGSPLTMKMECKACLASLANQGLHSFLQESRHEPAAHHQE